jgi:hypothetical protein
VTLRRELLINNELSFICYKSFDNVHLHGKKCHSPLSLIQQSNLVCSLYRTEVKTGKFFNVIIPLLFIQKLQVSSIVTLEIIQKEGPNW